MRGPCTHCNGSGKAPEPAPTSEVKEKYDPAELIYAAFHRCPCGAGMAYVRNPPKSMMHWDCSAILTRTAVAKGEPGSVRHSAVLPFVFWEIKSEQQPSVNGATTRPA